MATYYINADTGNDTTGSGTSAAPWLTFSKAHTSAASGDTIVAQDSSNTYTFASVTFGKSLYLRAERIGDAIFDGTAGAAAWTLGVYSLYVDNIIFQNVTTNALGMFYMSTTATRTLRFRGCIIRDCILGSSNSNAAIVTNLAVSSKVVMDIDFIGCSFENISAQYNTNDTQIVTLTNNSTPNGSEVSLRFKNCTIVLENVSYPLKEFIQLIYPAVGDELYIDNCIFDNSTGSTVNFAKYYGSSSSTWKRVHKSCFYNVSSPPVAFTNGTGNTTSAPSYADSSSGDYRLQPDSVGSFEGGIPQ